MMGNPKSRKTKVQRFVWLFIPCDKYVSIKEKSNELWGTISPVKQRCKDLFGRSSLCDNAVSIQEKSREW